MLLCEAEGPVDLLGFCFPAADPSDRLALLLLKAVTAGPLFLSGVPLAFFLNQPKHAISWSSVQDCCLGFQQSSDDDHKAVYARTGRSKELRSATHKKKTDRELYATNTS
ncbi:hypothetical protein GW17_00052047 [Ensete ventricosum]|nr:hypothetical protein GW17_00052047 [Ensete ventricosum]